MARKLFVKNIQKAGLSHKRYTLHCLRHTFASELLNAGMRLECGPASRTRHIKIHTVRTVYRGMSDLSHFS